VQPFEEKSYERGALLALRGRGDPNALCALSAEGKVIIDDFDDWTAAQVFGTNVTILSCPHFLIVFSGAHKD
jgi:hypothetical protein